MTVRDVSQTIIVIAQPDTGRLRPSSPTGLWTAARDPIREVRIQGNQTINEAEIQAALENGPEEIEKAIDSLEDALPYFSRISLQFENDGTRRVAVITVVEKTLSFRLLFPCGSACSVQSRYRLAAWSSP